MPTHELFPDYFILATEACIGAHFWERDVILGCWERGNQYSHSILMVRPPHCPVEWALERAAGTLPLPSAPHSLGRHLGCPIAEPEPLCGRLD